MRGLGSAVLGRRPRRHWATLGTVVLLAMLSSFAVGCKSVPQSSALPILSLPNETRETIDIARGDGGGVVILAFWATHCAPSMQELAEFDVLQREFASAGLRVYAINIDGPKSQARVPGFLASVDYSFPVLMDFDTEAMMAYNQRGECPYYVVLADDGTVLRGHGGYSTGDLEAQLRGFLSERLGVSPEDRPRQGE